ncbi:MAG: galactose-1-phosphate uridylyltransferase [Candidatus Sungbacteria bacterium]|uniref:Galactose-1-phosphate uridylyltransferase n=1 Tax=Candidatus Sungiibacteriota bacterium TaxID=2750080 RepID=A0A9D6DQP5_9BACT|nr:galactose-1-phosphate uridylyltransferase [Candidatus Sungbacteria bacterium]
MDLGEKKEISELRQDPVGRDWVVISTGRAKRPEAFKSSGILEHETPINLCPFENPKEHGNEVIKTYPSLSGSGWTVQVVKNKFPIMEGQNCRVESKEGLYLVKDNAGYHEVVVFKDHRRSLAQLEIAEAGQIIKTYRERYLELSQRMCADYILIFHNHGRPSGASISHPHSQMMALSFIPSDIRRSLEGSRKYKEERGRCVHCDILEWELKEKKRIIFENKSFVAVVPYVPRFSYEVRIFPKAHQSYFENISDDETIDFAEALKISLAKIYHGLNNPAYNFFIHTPPAERDHEYDYYHWHLEINPRLNIWGGFELGTGGEVIDVDPDEAAEYLRGIKT